MNSQMQLVLAHTVSQSWHWYNSCIPEFQPVSDVHIWVSFSCHLTISLQSSRVCGSVGTHTSLQVLDLAWVGKHINYINACLGVMVCKLWSVPGWIIYAKLCLGNKPCDRDIIPWTCGKLLPLGKQWQRNNIQEEMLAQDLEALELSVPKVINRWLKGLVRSLIGWESFHNILGGCIIQYPCTESLNRTDLY